MNQGLIKKTTLYSLLLLGACLLAGAALFVFPNTYRYASRNDGSIGGKGTLLFAIDLPYENLRPGEERFAFQKFKVPEELYLVEFVPKVEGDAGALQHLDLYYTGEKGIYCDKLPLHIFSAGYDLLPMDIASSGYGIKAEKGKELMLAAHIVNQGLSTENGTVRLALRALPKARPAVPVMLSIADYCRDKNLEKNVPAEYTIPAGVLGHVTASERAFRMPERAKLLGWRAYLSAYGADLELLRNTAVVAKVSAPDSAGDVGPALGYSTNEYFWESPVILSKGEELMLKAEYRKPPGIVLPAMTLGYLFLDMNPE